MQPDQVIWLPVWIPGSYLIREFSRHIGRITAIAADGSPRPVTKLDKNHWQIATTGESLTLHYQVYAHDLSVRGCFVDRTRIFINPAALCVALEGYQGPYAMQLVRPSWLEDTSQGWTLTTTLPALRIDHPHCDGLHFQAADYLTLIEHPLEWSPQTVDHFTVAGIPHCMAIAGRHRANRTRLTADLQRICQSVIDLFGTAPFSRYTFMTLATTQDYGGLEHRDCTALVTPRDDLPAADEPDMPGKAYQRFLGLCSHEYFHSWLVKFIRPLELTADDLHRENYTRLLWIFEGFTSYYDDLFLLRSGVIDLAEYARLLTAQVSRYWQTPGRHLQSLSESSFDAWIKYYRPDENSQNAGTSYYNQGALTALVLDQLLRQHGHSLDELLRHWYAQAQLGQAVDEQSLQGCLQQRLPEPVATHFWQAYIDGCNELPLEATLQGIGLTLTRNPLKWPFGIRITEQASGLQVSQVLRDSAAALAGLSAQDQIIAIDHIRATPARWQQLADATGRQHDPVQLHWFRRDELHSAALPLSWSELGNAQIVVADEALARHALLPAIQPDMT